MQILILVSKDRWSVTEFGVYEIEQNSVSGLFARGMPIRQFKSLLLDANRSAKPRSGPTGRLFVQLHDAEEVWSLVRIRETKAVISMGGGRGDTTAMIPLSPGHQVLEFYPVEGEPKTVAATVVAGRTDTLVVSLRARLR